MMLHMCMQVQCYL